jgi:hypothetical protein
MDVNPVNKVLRKVARRYCWDRGFYPRELQSEEVDLRIYRPYFSAGLRERFERLFPGCSEVDIACLTWQSQVKERIRRIVRHRSRLGGGLVIFVAKTRSHGFYRIIINSLRALGSIYRPVMLIKVDTRMGKVLHESPILLNGPLGIQETQSSGPQREIRVIGQTHFNNGRLEGMARMDNWLGAALPSRENNQDKGWKGRGAYNG